MKKMMLLFLMSLTLLGGHDVLAQNAASTDKATAGAGPVITGHMIRKFVWWTSSEWDPGERRETEVGRRGRWRKVRFTNHINTFQDVDVQYDEQTRQWRMYAKAKARHWRAKQYWNMWIKYNEQSGLLVISLVKENRNQWVLKRHPNIKVTIAPDKSTFRLDFLASFEGTNDAGYHYNWMGRSWLLVNR